MTKAEKEQQQREKESAALLAQLKGAKRLLKAKRAQDDLIQFAELMMPDPEDPDDPEKSRYHAARHHRIIAAALEEVDKGKICRLIIDLGPRHGKSQLSSKFFPAWFMGRDPYRQMIVASYSAQMAEDFGREVREYLKSPAYRQVFPGVELRKGSASSGRLQTTAGGIAAFVGVGGALTGRGANALLIDDFVKDHEEANSQLIRDKTWDWFTSTAMTRLMGGMGLVVIVATRWHEDDLIGRLIDPTNKHYRPEIAKDYKIIHLPALAEENDILGRQPGEPLWPERISKEFLESQRILSPRNFAALYQGRPTPEDGDFFKSEWIRTYQPHELPRNLRIYAASDHAVSVAQDADRNCFGAFGVDESNNIWILPDIFWETADSEKAVDEMLALIARRKPLFWWAEKGHISKSIGPFLRQRQRETSNFCAVIEMTPTKDKMTRARSIQGRMAMGMVRFPGFAPWFENAKQEMLKFPFGKHDDFCDWLSWCGLGLDSIVRPNAEHKPYFERPRSGSIEWVKDSSRRQERARRLRAAGGF